MLILLKNIEKLRLAKCELNQGLGKNWITDSTSYTHTYTYYYQNNSIRTGQVKTAELLIKAGANVDNTDDGGASILHEIIVASKVLICAKMFKW